jgi:hypothetical protein
VKHCERCGTAPDVIREGPFAGDYRELPYCAICSKDLCLTCIAEGHCREADDHRHRRDVECDKCMEKDQTDPACLDCRGTGMVLR